MSCSSHGNSGFDSEGNGKQKSDTIWLTFLNITWSTGLRVDPGERERVLNNAVHRLYLVLPGHSWIVLFCPLGGKHGGVTGLVNEM